jgi:hypothetical protein
MRRRRAPCGSLGSSNRISFLRIAMVEDDKRQFEERHSLSTAPSAS